MYQVPDAEGGAKDVAAKGGIKGKKVLNLFYDVWDIYFLENSCFYNKSFSQIFQENAS